MLDNTLLASTYRLAAVNFRMSAEVIQSHFENNGEELVKNLKAIPFYYLISHACELLLKSALLKRGVAEKELRKSKIRHNLSLLLHELEKKGVVVSEQTRLIVNILSEQHSAHELRYKAVIDNGYPIYTTHIPQTYEMLDELMMKTRVSDDHH